VPRAYKIGRRLFFDPADVDLWVASRITRIDPVR
jgi:predicted DNA-binding transcriptional regulator AlpA